MRIVKKQREFKHETSCFKDWKFDSESVLEKCLEHDFTFWKAARFCKDPDELTRVKKIIKENFKEIKEIYHYLISKSSYPAIGWQDFTNWCFQIKVVPDDKVPLATIDRAFVAANVELEKIPGNVNPDNALNRYEFVEIIVRLAKAKYIDTGNTKSYSEALKKLIQNHILKHDSSDPWQMFREKKLWTVPVNDLMEPNVPALKKLYESYFEPRKKSMSIDDTISLFMKDTGLLAQEKDVVYCFGMSKMTCVIETKESDKKYQFLMFSEFLEMVGRVAHYKFCHDEEMKNIPLPGKIEVILDEIL